MKIAITGYKGFIGTNLVNILKPLNYKLFLFDKKSSLTKLRLFNPDVICHLASDPLVKNDNINVINSNIILTYKILNTISNKCHIIFPSSATIYGSSQTKKTEIDNYAPQSLYAITKLTCEEIIKIYYNQHKIGNFTILRLVANVGPYSTHGIIHDFIQKLQSDNIYLEVFGEYPGSQKPYIHVLDTVNAIIHSINNKLTGIFNVCVDDSIFVNDVAHYIMSILNINKQIKWMGNGFVWFGDDYYVNIDNTKLKSTGWQLQYPYSKEAIYYAIKR